MKHLVLVFGMLINIAACQTYAPGYDFNLFKGTPVYDLAKAVENQDTQKIYTLVKIRKLNVNYREPKFDQSLLFLAIFDKKYSSISKLLEVGADPNLVSSKDRSTPLITACEYSGYSKDTYRVLADLIHYGANVNYQQCLEVKRPDGSKIARKNTPLQYICNFGTVECAKLLINSGARLDYYPRNGFNSIITQATLNATPGILHYLLIEKKVPIPEYCYIRQPGTKNERKITLLEVLKQWNRTLDTHDSLLMNVIFDYLKK